MTAPPPPNAFAGKPESGVDAQNPWPGLASFTEDLSRYFFGRNDEIAQLLRLVKRETLTVLFGQSGLGKSSLLQAGLFPALRQADFVPVYLRLNHDEKAPPLAAQVRAALRDALKASGVEAPPFPEDETLWEYFHRKDVDFWNAKNRLVTPVLVFDQFEEIFTLGRASAERRGRGQVFLSDLSDLTENRPPPALKQRMETGGADAGRFFFDREFCKVLLSLREDYLPDLEGLRLIMRSVMQNRLRIARLQSGAALQAVSGPGAGLLDPDVAERIVQFVAGAEEGAGKEAMEREVDPALLNVVCRELNNRRLQSGQPKITTGLLAGTRREILSEFYERSLRDLPPAVRAFVEDRLLTKSGYRDNVALDNALCELAEHGVTRDAIDRLVNRRLLRLEERLGVARVELTHDVLTGVIRASRDVRREREVLAALEETRRRAAREKRRARAILATISILFVLTSIFAVLAYRMERQARDQARTSVARRVATQADTVLGLPEKPVEVAVLLAVESLRQPTSEGDHVLRRALTWLPQPLPSLQEANVKTVALSSNGTFALTAGTNLSVSVWETAAARRVATLSMEGPATAIALSRDEATLAAGDGNQTHLWRHWWTSNPTNVVVIPGQATALAFSSDGKYLAIGSATVDQPTRVVETSGAGALVASLKPEDGQSYSVTALQFSPDGDYLVSRGQRLGINRAGRPTPMGEGALQVWHWRVGRQVGALSGYVHAMWFDQGQDLLRTDKGQEPLWTIGNGVVRKHEKWQSNVAENKEKNFDGTLGVVRYLSRDGTFLATVGGSGGAATRVWKWEDWERNRRTEITRVTSPEPVALSVSDGHLALVTESEVKLWAFPERQEVVRMDNVFGVGLIFRFSNDSRYLATADRNSLRIGKVSGGKEFVLPTDANTLTFSSDDTYLAAAGDKAIDIWKDWQAGQSNRIAQLPLRDVQAIAFSSDGQYLAVMQGGAVGIWENWKTPQPLEISSNWPPTERLKVPNEVGRPAIITFSPEDRYLSAAIGGAVRVWENWNGPTPKQFASENVSADAIAFTADGNYFASANEGEDGVWVVHVSRLGRNQIAEMVYDEPVHDVALSPDGKYLAIGCNGTAQLWDVERREKVISIPCAADSQTEVNGVVFSPDGRYLATLTDGNTVQVWHRHAEDLVAMAGARLRRNLTPKEWRQYFGDEPYRKTFLNLP